MLRIVIICAVMRLVGCVYNSLQTRMCATYG